MKAFLQHDDSGLLYGKSGNWVGHPQQALSFSNTEDAEHFQRRQQITAAHAITRIDPALLSRLARRAPGAYQLGE
jgi:hypothetical protein